MRPNFHFEKITLSTLLTINHKGKKRGRKIMEEFIAIVQVRDYDGGTWLRVQQWVVRNIENWDVFWGQSW